jgi:ADP-ribosylglycohydrolase
MIDNCSLVKNLIGEGKMHMHSSPILDTTPTIPPTNLCFEKVEGMLLGAAIGDSLGAPTEGMCAGDRYSKYGEIKDYIPCRRSGQKAVGAPTDDTQLTYWTLKQLISDGGFVPDNVAKIFCKHHIIGIGGAVKAFINNHKDNHKPWYESGTDNLGNGALMRISPVLVPYMNNAHPSMYADAALDAMLTHNSFANTAGCVTWIKILWDLLGMKASPEPKWWVNTYCSIAEKLEGNTKLKFNSPTYSGFNGSLWQFVDKVVNEAINKRLPVAKACNIWGSSGYITETIPSALYILAMYSDNLEEAMLSAVNYTIDNDSIGSIVGAAVGALHGLMGIPYRWINGLTGRTRAGIDDSGEIFKLILSAKKSFWLK